MNTSKYSSINAQWRGETFWAWNKTIPASVPFVSSCDFCCRPYQETLPYIVSDASPPRVVISTWSTKVRLTFQFSRWQVEAELGSLILYLFLWCVWPVSENKEFSPKYLPGLWEQGTRRLGTYLSLKKKKHSPLSCGINCCKSIRWKDKMWSKTDGRLVPIGGITEGWRARADKCLLTVHERRCGNKK